MFITNKQAHTRKLAKKFCSKENRLSGDFIQNDSDLYSPDIGDIGHSFTINTRDEILRSYFDHGDEFSIILKMVEKTYIVIDFIVHSITKKEDYYECILITSKDSEPLKFEKKIKINKTEIIEMLEKEVNSQQDYIEVLLHEKDELQKDLDYVQNNLQQQISISDYLVEQLKLS